jgi:uncharacterized RDD family membrane protein YckC
VTPHVQPDRDVHRQGRYAGAVTRFAAYVVDLLVLVTSFTLAVQAVEYLGPRVIGVEISLADDPTVGSTGLMAWALVYFSYPLATFGRTAGMGVLGLLLVRADGTDGGPGRAVVRVVAFPLSILTFGLGFLPILLRRDRRALHDLIAGTAVVYGWDAKAARQRLLGRHPASNVTHPG